MQKVGNIFVLCWVLTLPLLANADCGYACLQCDNSVCSSCPPLYYIVDAYSCSANCTHGVYNTTGDGATLTCTSKANYTPTFQVTSDPLVIELTFNNPPTLIQSSLTSMIILSGGLSYTLTSTSSNNFLLKLSPSSKILPRTILTITLQDSSWNNYADGTTQYYLYPRSFSLTLSEYSPLSDFQSQFVTYLPSLVNWGGVAATALSFWAGIKHWGGLRTAHLILMLSCIQLTQYIDFAPTYFMQRYFQETNIAPMRYNWVPNLFEDIFSAVNFSPTNIFSGWKPLYFASVSLDYYFINNFGSQIWTLISYLFLLGLINLIYLLRNRVPERTKEIITAVRLFIQWNLLFAQFIAYGISLAFTAFLQYQILDLASPYAILSFSLSYVFLVSVLCGGFCVVRWIRLIIIDQECGIPLEPSRNRAIFYSEWKFDGKLPKYYAVGFYLRFVISGILIATLSAYPLVLVIILVSLHLIFAVGSLIINPFAKRYDLIVMIFFEILFNGALVCVLAMKIRDFLGNYDLDFRDGFTWTFLILSLIFVYSVAIISFGEIIYDIVKYYRKGKTRGLKTIEQKAEIEEVVSIKQEEVVDEETVKREAELAEEKTLIKTRMARLFNRRVRGQTQEINNDPKPIDENYITFNTDVGSGRKPTDGLHESPRMLITETDKPKSVIESQRAQERAMYQGKEEVGISPLVNLKKEWNPLLADASNANSLQNSPQPNTLFHLTNRGEGRENVSHEFTINHIDANTNRQIIEGGTRNTFDIYKEGSLQNSSPNNTSRIINNRAKVSYWSPEKSKSQAVSIAEISSNPKSNSGLYLPPSSQEKFLRTPETNHVFTIKSETPERKSLRTRSWFGQQKHFTENQETVLQNRYTGNIANPIIELGTVEPSSQLQLEMPEGRILNNNIFGTSTTPSRLNIDETQHYPSIIMNSDQPNRRIYFDPPKFEELPTASKAFFDIKKDE